MEKDFVLMKRLLCILLILGALPLSAQVDRKDVRAGNRKFRKGDYKNAEIDYRKAVVKDSLSMAAEYNLASDLYRQEKFDDAQAALETVKDVAPASKDAAAYYYNLGDVALQENYIYAKLMLKNQGGGGGNDDQNQQDQGKNQDQQNQDQNKDQQNQPDQQNQNQDRQEQPQDQPARISPQQAQQMLQAVQARWRPPTSCRPTSSST